jgi:hypothetical protein
MAKPINKAIPETITTSQQFAAIVRRAKNESESKLVIKSQKFYQHQLNKFKDCEKVTLFITNKKPKRSEQQNRYYFGVYLPLIAQETGERNIMRLHELFKGEFLTEGIVDVLGKKVRMKKSTTELSVSEFCKYIMDIESETGIPAPSPEIFNLISFEEGLTKKYDSQQTNS